MTAATLPVTGLPHTVEEGRTTLTSRSTMFILSALLILIGVVKAQNMFHFPYYQDIEGTTISNGWALLTTGNLSAYTYAYEEPPVGTFLMSLWLALSGGLNTYGFPINTGRVLMLVFHLLTTALVYLIAKKVTRQDIPAIVATLVFAFSPLATLIQRRVLVDNLMIVFMLTAMYLVVGDGRRLWQYIMSAFVFGLAVLTKGASLFFMPAFVFMIRSNADRMHRRFAIGLWVALFLFLLSFYFLYAQMKQELFPQGFFLGGDFPHVSLLERIADRGPDTGRLLNVGSGLTQSLDTWVNLANSGADPVILYGGVFAGVFVLLLALDQRRLRPIVIINIACLLYLFIGGHIYDSAAIFFLPFLAINIGIVIGALAGLLASAFKNLLFKYALAVVVAVVLLYPFWVFYSSRLNIYTLDQVQGQLEAIRWVKTYVPPDSVVVTDNYAFVELRQQFENVHHYWKVDTDPAIKFNVLNDNVCKIDYMITTPQVFADIEVYKLELIDRAFRSSQVLMTYPNNGWPVEVRQVSKVNCAPQVSAQPVDQLTANTR